MAMELTGEALVADLRERLAAAEAEVAMLNRIRVRRDATTAAAFRADAASIAAAEERAAAAEARAVEAEARADALASAGVDDFLAHTREVLDAAAAEKQRLRDLLWPHWLRRNLQLQRLEEAVASADVRLAALELAIGAPPPAPSAAAGTASGAASGVDPASAEPPRTRRRQM